MLSFLAVRTMNPFAMASQGGHRRASLERVGFEPKQADSPGQADSLNTGEVKVDVGEEDAIPNAVNGSDEEVSVQSTTQPRRVSLMLDKGGEGKMVDLKDWKGKKK